MRRNEENIDDVRFSIWRLKYVLKVRLYFYIRVHRDEMTNRRTVQHDRTFYIFFFSQSKPVENKHDRLQYSRLSFMFICFVDLFM